MSSIISIIQLIIAAMLIVLVLIQDRGDGLSETFGGSGMGGFTAQRRGMERILHIATVVGIALFGVTSLAILLVR